MYVIGKRLFRFTCTGIVPFFFTSMVKNWILILNVSLISNRLGC